MTQRLLFLVLYLITNLAAAQSLPGSGNSLTFNGSSQYINCGTADRGIVNTLTVEAWVKTSSLQGQFAVTKYSNSLFSESGFEFGTVQGRAAIYGRAGKGDYFTSGLSTTLVSDGRWHHIAGQVEQNVWRIYVDGILENSNTYSYSGGDLRTPEPMTIGTYTYLTNFYFQGDIDEVRVWRTVRSVADIQQNMCRKFATAPADLVAYYRLDQSSGLTATDQGSQPTNGSLVGFSGSPWHTSGAPLGDASTSLYQASWAGTRVALTTATGDSAVVSGVLAQTRGVQLYTVNSAPSIAAGAGAAPTYVGVFTAGTGTLPSYSLRLHPLGGAACRSAQQRPANDQSWTTLSTTPSVASSLLASNLSYRGEYILLGVVPPPLTISGDSLLCPGATGRLLAAATGATAYSWNTGATTAGITVTQAGTYTVTASFAGGCTTTAQLRVRTLAAPTVAIGGDSVLCAGGTAQLATFVSNAASPLTYRWNTGATTASLVVRQPGVYSVTVTNATGCVSQQASYRVRMGLPTPTFTLGADTTLCEGSALTLNGPAGTGLRYLWSDGSTNPQLLVSTAGTYTLRVSNQCGTTQAARTVALRNCLLIPNIVTANGDTHNDVFFVQGLTGTDWSLDVYNRWGRTVLHTSSYRNDWGQDAAPGLYYVLLRRASTGYSYKGWVEVVR